VARGEGQGASQVLAKREDRLSFTPRHSPLATIILATPGWPKLVRGVTRRAPEWAAAALSQQGLKPAHCALNIVLGDDALLQSLNRDYRSKNYATNVLSYPSFTPRALRGAVESATAKQKIFLGEIYLAQGVIAHQARQQGKTMAAHTAHLVVHGVLHLLGHDHLRPRPAARMENAEREILGRFGIADPY
jgi:probable rRNA maturation factor